MATKADAPIRFRGSPRIVEALAQLTPQQIRSTPLSVDLKLPKSEQPAAPLTLQTESVSPSVARLRFSLPESLAPGNYEGTVQINGESQPIVVEVEPFPYLTISPRQLSLQVKPGSQATVGLTLVNSGNVSCEINKVHAFGLFDVEGAERAVGVAIGSSDEKGQGRLNRLLDEAADNHGGLVRVTVQEGLGAIEPGELRNLKATLRFSDRLKPGHTYTGTWPLYNLRYSVQVYVASPTPAKAKGKQAQEESK
jgi:hypothetical protein